MQVLERDGPGQLTAEFPTLIIGFSGWTSSLLEGTWSWVVRGTDLVICSQTRNDQRVQPEKETPLLPPMANRHWPYEDC
jgi:hypothetical protein